MRVNTLLFASAAGALCLLAVPAAALPAEHLAPKASALADNFSTAECISKRQMHAGQSIITIVFDPSDFSASETEICNWIGRGARAVDGYFGRYPVPSVKLVIKATGGSGVNGGNTYGDINGGALINVRLGRNADNDALIEDWVMTHEMVHLAVPSVPDESHWLEEGIATYVEPIARVQQGELSTRKIWADMRDGIPKGMPKSGDEGLDHTATWGRTYWGGALFCLIADVQIRERTHNRFGLRDALRGIVAVGGNIEHDGTAAQVFAVGDEAVGVPVLSELYKKYGDAPDAPDLENLWQRLGVIADEDVGVRFDDHAPLAAIRLAITAPNGAVVAVPAISRE